MMLVRVNKFLFILPFILFLGGMFISESNALIAAILMIIGLFLYVVLHFMLKCPSCKKSPYLSKPKGRSSQWAYSFPFPDRQCSFCRYDFMSDKVS